MPHTHRLGRVPLMLQISSTNIIRANLTRLRKRGQPAANLTRWGVLKGALAALAVVTSAVLRVTEYSGSAVLLLKLLQLLSSRLRQYYRNYNFNWKFQPNSLHTAAIYSAAAAESTQHASPLSWGWARWPLWHAAISDKSSANHMCTITCVHRPLR